MDSEKKKELMRTIKFTLFSISAGAIQLLVTEVLLNFLTDWTYWVRYLIGLVISVIWNFTLNRRYTFQSANNVPIAMLKVAAFYCVFTPLSTLLANFLESDLLWPELLVQVIVMLLNFVTEYIYDRLFVFGKSIDTNELAKRKG